MPKVPRFIGCEQPPRTFIQMWPQLRHLLLQGLLVGHGPQSKLTIANMQSLFIDDALRHLGNSDIAEETKPEKRCKEQDAQS